MTSPQLARILHVDDEPGILAIAAFALKKLGGYEVLSCGDSRQAVEKARSFKPDLVLLDVMMPFQDGTQVFAALRAEPETRDIPVVFLTAKVQPREVQGLIATGADGVLSKPFDPAQLCKSLEAVWQARLESRANGGVTKASEPPINLQ